MLNATIDKHHALVAYILVVSDNFFATNFGYLVFVCWIVKANIAVAFDNNFSFQASFFAQDFSDGACV